MKFSVRLTTLVLALLASVPVLRGDPPTANLTVLHHFGALATDKTNADGDGPAVAVLQASDGNFYGTTWKGGVHAGGTAFRITPAGTITTLHAFDLAPGTASTSTEPFNLIQAPDQNLYGVQRQGGAFGEIFQLTTNGAFSTLFDFHNTDGSRPQGPLLVGSDGNFYGETGSGFSSTDPPIDGGGVVYRFDAGTKTLTVLKSFDNTLNEGGGPSGGLIEPVPGTFYGTAFAAGPDDAGTIFTVTVSGGSATFNRVYEFPSGKNGAYPADGLILAADGNFYGTTRLGGNDDATANYGTIFRLTPAGTVSIVYAFSVPVGGKNSDGAQPVSGLVQGDDGNFYGTTPVGGANGQGTIFQFTPSGTFTTLHSFAALGASAPFANADGAAPTARLIQGSDGRYYGTAPTGGTNGNGVVFALQVSPVVTDADTVRTPVNAAFSFQITAANGPESFGASGLPDGLTVNTAAPGLISGTPTQVGTFDVTLSATNAGGTGTALLTLIVLPPPPVVTSETTAQGTQGSAFSYQITATNDPSRFGVLGLPPGLTVNAKTGAISGTPTKAGTFHLTLKAINAGGTGTATLTLTVDPAPPVVTSAPRATAEKGSPFSYQITATNNPTRFGVLGLPPGLKVDAKTGLIAGTPQAPGNVHMTLNAFNAGGKGTGTLLLTITAAAPVITSADTASGKVNKPFSFQVTATHSPTSFGATGLPTGLSINARTGLISGTPTSSGTKTVTVEAANATGTGQQTLTLTVALR